MGIENNRPSQTNLRTPFNPHSCTIPPLPKTLARQLLQIRAGKDIGPSVSQKDWSSPVLCLEARLRALWAISLLSYQT